ncbi:PTS sugar transporter subunit IIA [Enterococcus sp. BWB1-3]|uniref:PTS galactosamine/N-acetylgalactosamine transporter subunit IIA n=1 Tax=unclassified Enterococcus TaxID=2608891 RepID=UPI0019231174|nr:MULTISPECIES: PTS galactosamine/N-acetylgalactosamine transporter subunit IIA [unclassified Enterococcus]MBL1228666.1 PTS sugar transporter subunit IIA [Enterococcus sp. BWB1-3]MCB5953652.1 PTS sugar transporter subunit IIA [Enterococcus sp. CWB-B31]
MIGCILTGHGSFAPGMMGAVEMIAGPQELFEVVSFQEEEALEVFEEKMEKAIKKLLDSSDGVVIFSDLLGGTPFRTAMLAASERENAEVLAGTNLPLLIEGSGLRCGADSAKEFVSMILEVGRSGLVHAQLELSEETDNEFEEEGI